VVPCDYVKIAFRTHRRVLWQVEVRLERRETFFVDAGNARSGDRADDGRRTAFQRRLHRGEQLVDRHRRVALGVEQRTRPHRLFLEHDVHAGEKLIDRHLAVAIAVACARKYRAGEHYAGAQSHDQCHGTVEGCAIVGDLCRCPHPTHRARSRNTRWDGAMRRVAVTPAMRRLASLPLALLFVLAAADGARGHGMRLPFATWGGFPPATVRCQRMIARSAAQCAVITWALRRTCRDAVLAGGSCDEKATTDAI